MAGELDEDTVVVDGDEIEIEIDLEEEDEAPPQGKKPEADERLSKGNRDDDDEEERRRQNETPEEKRERRRDEGRRRREVRRERTQEDSLIIRELSGRLQNAEKILQEQGIKNLEKDITASVTSAERWKREARRAEIEFARAVDEGRGVDAAKAQSYKDECLRHATWFEQDALKGKEELEERSKPKQTQQPQAGDLTPEQAEANNVRKFMDRHPGFDPAGGDDDSARALEIDAEVKADGFHPATAAYWQELEKRLRSEGIDLTQDDDDDTRRAARREHHSQSQPRDKGKFASEERRESRGGPPVGGKGGGKGKEVVRVPREVADMIREAGMWDNVKVRNQMIREYQQNLKK